MFCAVTSLISQFYPAALSQVNGHISEEKKKVAMEFLTFSANMEQSRKLVIPEEGSEESKLGYDPYRYSHLNVEDYVKQGKLDLRTFVLCGIMSILFNRAILLLGWTWLYLEFAWLASKLLGDLGESLLHSAESGNHSAELS